MRGLVRLTEAATGRLLKELIKEEDRLRELVFSPDDSSLACVWDSEVELVSPDALVPLPRLTDDSLDDTLVAFSPDGHVLTLTWNTATLWDLSTSPLMHVHSPKGYALTSAAFAGDGARLALASCYDTDIYVCDSRTGRMLYTIDEQPSNVSHLAVTPDGRALISGGDDGAVRLWDWETGELLMTLMVMPADHEAMVSYEWIAFTPAGELTGSLGIGRFVQWQQGGNTLPADAHWERFYRPDLAFVWRRDRPRER